jgi:hypothetical protein
MNRLYVKLSLLGAQLALLAGCGSSNTDTLQGGIEGSGSPRVSASPITTSGVVTALGSLFVNGVEYDVSSATITIDDAPASEAELAPGLIALVEGYVDADGVHGEAKRVTVDIAVAGPVTAVDPEHHRLTILGQTIEIDSSTNIDGRIDGDPLGGLDVGSDLEVSGFADSSGVLHARHVAPRKPTRAPHVTGYVANLDETAHTFSINGQLVSYATATVTGFGSRALGGAPVRVEVEGFDQSTLVAAAVSLRDPALPGDLGNRAVLQGRITHLDSDNDFDVDGHPVVATPGTTIDGEVRTGAVGLDDFVTVRGQLVADGVVRAQEIDAVLPGHLVGQVTIDGVSYELSGLLTSEGAFRLNIADESEAESGLGQLVGSFSRMEDTAEGAGVIIGEGCGLSQGGRFCGRETPIRIELNKTGALIDQGASGVITVGTDGGEETWPVNVGYWGGRAGFDPNRLNLAGVLKMHQAEFTQGLTVMMTIGAGYRLFFQSPETGCTGNGEIGWHGDGSLDVYDVTLTIGGCNAAFAYLNSDFEGLATVESIVPWDYDYSVLRMWVSARAGAAIPAAITLWASDMY